MLTWGFVAGLKEDQRYLNLLSHAHWSCTMVEFYHSLPPSAYLHSQKNYSCQNRLSKHILSAHSYSRIHWNTGCQKKLNEYILIYNIQNINMYISYDQHEALSIVICLGFVSNLNVLRVRSPLHCSVPPFYCSIYIKVLMSLSINKSQ